MPFSKCLGNDQVKNRLLSMLETKRIPGTLLFSGLADKIPFAEAFAQALTSSFNVHQYKPEGKSGMHSMGSMQELIKEVHLPPFEAPYKVFIIHDAERMLPTSSNALLKTLEEPPADTVLILLATEPKSLLPTILSRCSHVPFFATAKTTETKPWEADLIAFLNGSADATKLETFFTDLKEEESIQWYKEVDLLFEKIFHYHHSQGKPMEKIADLIQECRDAVQSHIKLKNILEYFCMALLRKQT